MMKNTSHPRGSILIWTVLLGVSLTTVFFFFAQRLNFNAAIQRKSIEHQNAQQFIDSYVAYLESLRSNEVTVNENIEIETETGIKITGEFTNIRYDVVGHLDVGESAQYDLSEGNATVEWNLCNDEEGRPFTVTPNMGDETSGRCPAEDYDNAVTVEAGMPFVLEAPSVPVSFRISSEGAAILDNTWDIDVEVRVGPRERIKINKNFIPEPAGP